MQTIRLKGQRSRPLQRLRRDAFKHEAAKALVKMIGDWAVLFPPRYPQKVWISPVMLPAEDNPALGTERAPNFTALVASSCSARPIFCAATGVSMIVGPTTFTRCDEFRNGSK